MRNQPQKNPNLLRVALCIFAAVAICAVYLIGNFFVEQKRMDAAYQEASIMHERWLGYLSVDPEDGAYSQDTLHALREDLLSTSVSITGIHSPNAAIATTAREYRKALEEAAGAVSRFDATDESNMLLIDRLTSAARIGFEYMVLAAS